MKKALVAFGTRPEAIKLAPVCRRLSEMRRDMRVVCCVTGQHRQILDPMLEFFQITPDYDLNIIQEDQTLFDITVRVLEEIRPVLEKERPDLVVVQGDTTSAFVVTLAAYYLKIPVAHVEAGLRSFDKFQPYPEEINRRLLSHVADLHFCPTPRAAENLRKENIPSESIYVTGNTVIDALLYTARTLDEGHEATRRLEKLALPPGRLILVTGHRRENFGQGLRNLSLALADLAHNNPDVTVVYSVHPNPHVREPVGAILGAEERIRLIPPPDYFSFVALMKRAFLIITDSGGIQEEAPSLKKPVLVARNVTERPEAVEAGAAVLVGTDRDRIVTEAQRLLDNPDHYSSMILETNPFGDGNAAEKIVRIIGEFLT
ncbi:MAG: UDP-N-acetylglucosamine 2-epimerase (non-hydrolyzing) [Deltaproteobacteria bacterium]|nr:UDP-N-acetylglucosamine 2-epimerase (non-hydrolyzing) [Deltaproteobacteria bacterium]